MDDPRWHALQVRHRFEKIVDSRLHDSGIEHYLPLQRFNGRAASRPTPIELPLFPGYVFCKCDTKSRPALRAVPGVLGIAAPTDARFESEIYDLRRVMTAGIQVQSRPFTTAGPMMTIENGPLCGVSGVLEQTPQQRLLVLSVHLVSRSVAVEVEDGWTLSVSASPASSFRLRSIAS